jgi:hypothetical protein
MNQLTNVMNNWLADKSAFVKVEEVSRTLCFIWLCFKLSDMSKTVFNLSHICCLKGMTGSLTNSAPKIVDQQKELAGEGQQNRSLLICANLNPKLTMSRKKI